MDNEEKMTIIYPNKGWTSRGDFISHGEMIDAKGEPVYKFEGHWMQFGKILDIETNELIK